MLTLAALSLAVWVYLLFGHADFWRAGPALAPARPASAPPVTIIVPARDEAPTIGRALRSLLAQTYPGDLHLILVDDRSRDGTAEIARAIDDPRLTIIQGADRPQGWSGKLWALQQGVQQATTDLLFFTDADIEHRPDHLATLVAKLTSEKLDLVSEMVQLNCESLAERALVPAFVFFFTLLYPFALVNDPASRTAAAAGGSILVSAKALHQAGGLHIMRDALIDDVTLAANIKKNGKIWLGHSRLAASIRPYPHAADIWRMIARTAYVQLQFSPWRLTATVLGMALVFLVPPLATLFAHGPARLAGLLAWAASAVAFSPTLRRFGLSAAWAPFLPLAAAFYTAATVGSAADHISGRGIVWKQRQYS
jgi:hopene-associated glycosyltransferase HpnB